MAVLPNISASLQRRFRVGMGGTVEESFGPEPRSGLMTPLLPFAAFDLHLIGPMAKFDLDTGEPVDKWSYELPPMAITAMMVAPYHVEGAAPAGRIPWKLKAVGRVDAGRIMRGGKGLVSEDFVIVP